MDVVFTPADDQFLIEAIMARPGEARGLPWGHTNRQAPKYRTFAEVHQIMNENIAARGLPPRNFTPAHLYERYWFHLIFTTDKGNFDYDECMVRFTPWTLRELTYLKDRVPYAVLGGWSFSARYVNPNGSVNWHAIADSMPREDMPQWREYTGLMMYRAYHARILPDASAVFDQPPPQGGPVINLPDGWWNHPPPAVEPFDTPDGFWEQPGLPEFN